MLSEFPVYTKEQCGTISATHKNDRFCFTVSEEVSEYVHNNKAQNTFIIDLIHLLAKHGAKLEDIIEHFKAQHKEYVVEPVDNGECSADTRTGHIKPAFIHTIYLIHIHRNTQ